MQTGKHTPATHEPAPQLPRSATPAQDVVAPLVPRHVLLTQSPATRHGSPGAPATHTPTVLLERQCSPGSHCELSRQRWPR
jgi:hypothetical protein